MTNYQKMYVTIFNAVTDALDMLERGHTWSAKAILKEAQQVTEEIYIDTCEDADKKE